MHRKNKHSATVIDDHLEYKENKASLVDKKQNLEFDLSIQLRSGRERKKVSFKQEY